jgi:hypothetical protein
MAIKEIFVEIVSWPFAGISFYLTWKALNTGVARGQWGARFERSQSPFKYWLTVFSIALIGCLLVICGIMEIIHPEK